MLAVPLTLCSHCAFAFCIRRFVLPQFRSFERSDDIGLLRWLSSATVLDGTQLMDRVVTPTALDVQL